MKYLDALKIYNKGKPAWCSPRKGSVDYKTVIAIMKGIHQSTPLSAKKSSQLKGSLTNSSQLKVSIEIAKISSKKPSSKSLLFNKANVIQRFIKLKNKLIITKYNKANVIQRFLKNKLILTKHNLDTRIQRYNLIKKRLTNIKSKKCLTKKMFKNKQGYTIEGIVNLENKIGSDSVNASIYLTSIPYLLGSYPIASKLMKVNANNESETKINEWITENLILKKQSKHFVIMYKSTKCPPLEGIANKLLTGERLVNYNELCDGDLSALMKTGVRNDEETMLNLAFQVLIAIATYQNRIGYCHKDTHHGNFLYQENNEVGYYHYIYNGLDFYIKSCKYNMYIFDFGLSENISKVDNNTKFRDYVRVSMAFISKKANGIGWIDDDMDKNVSETMYRLMRRLASISGSNERIRNFDFFQEVIDDIFKKYKTNTGIFTTVKPSNVLNEIPFVINKVEAYPKINFGRANNIII